MIISTPTLTATLDVSAFKPIFESGIDWQHAGGRWHPLDRGSATDHYYSTVTVEGFISEVHAIRDAVIHAMRNASACSLTMEKAEAIFGVEFSYASPYSCRISTKEEAFSSEAPDGSVIGSWSFTVAPTFDISSRMVAAPTSLPALQAKKVHRESGSSATEHKMDSLDAFVPYGYSEPFFTVTFTGRAVDIAAAKSYFIQKRTSSFILESPTGIYYNKNGFQTQSVYFMDMQDAGNIDSSTEFAQIDVTFLVAG